MRFAQLKGWQTFNGVGVGKREGGRRWARSLTEVEHIVACWYGWMPNLLFTYPPALLWLKTQNRKAIETPRAGCKWFVSQSIAREHCKLFIMAPKQHGMRATTMATEGSRQMSPRKPPRVPQSPLFTQKAAMSSRVPSKDKQKSAQRTHGLKRARSRAWGVESAPLDQQLSQAHL